LHYSARRLPETTPVFTQKIVRRALPPLLAAALVAGTAGEVGAQGRRVVVRRSVTRPVVLVHPHPYPFYRFQGVWGPYGYPAWGPYARYGYGYWDDSAALRLQVTPRDAEVFVDGYAAGIVDDFDGLFQRLRLRPGAHEIAIHVDGYRTFRRNLYLGPGASQQIRHVMEPLAPGEPMEPPPEPAPNAGGPGDAAQRAPYPSPPPAPPVERAAPRGRFGTLSLRIQPADADILIDGERWSAPAGDSRIAVELPEGRHSVEIRKEGFAPYREDVLIRYNATLTLNVSLAR
jgi:hypothetical protein